VTLIRQPISDQTWQGIRTEFTLPALRQVHRRLSELMEDPEPVRQQLVRFLIDDGTFCPGIQLLSTGFPIGCSTSVPAAVGQCSARNSKPSAPNPPTFAGDAGCGSHFVP
jgi:hypothetical protein